MHPEAWSPYSCQGLQTSVYVHVYDCDPFCLRECACIHIETHVCQFGNLLYLADHQNPQLDMPEDSQVS